ncbi:MAG: WD40/YVTN/BNR-like repeat-containing protein [Ignavibacteria bacterium]
MNRNRIFSLSLLLFLLIQAANSQSQFEENPVSYTSATDRIKSFNDKVLKQQSSPFKNVEFKSIGPSVMSGRVVDLDVNPDDPTIFYVAYASGGVWKTTNNGISFTPIFDTEATLAIGDIAVDWKRNIIYVGTGENNSSRSSYPGLGIYKSTTEGRSWENIGLIETHRIGRIVIDPYNPDIIYVAALGHLFSSNQERGIYKTTDGGHNWKQVLFVNENTGGIDFVIDPINSNNVYAALWYRERRAWHGFEAGKTSGIYRSTNGGISWTLITNEASGFPVNTGTGRIGLTICPNHPEILYAVLDNLNSREKKEPKYVEAVTKELLKKISIEDFLNLLDDDLNSFLDRYNFPERYNATNIKQMVKEGKIKPLDLAEYTETASSRMFEIDYIGAEVYRTTDRGNTWKRMNTDYINDMFYSYGYYFSNIRVAPYDTSDIYVLGVPLLRSTDGGQSFYAILNENVHVDNHALWINPNRKGHLILGNDGGVNISYDYGKTWFKANTPPVGQFYSVNVDRAKPFNLYGGLQDNGVWYGPSNYKASYGWYQSGDYPYKSLMGGDGMQVVIDTRDNNTIYTGYQFGNYYRIDKVKKQYKYITPQRDIGEAEYRWNWQSPIHISEHNQDIIYLGSNYLHRSLNKGDKFEIISPDLTNGGKLGKVPYGTLTTIHESPLKFGLLYTGSDDGRICVSKDNGASWQTISDNLPQHFWISRVQASRFDTATVYASLNGFRWDNFEPLLYYSTNYGENWTQIGLDLPLEAINVIREDPKNSNVIYVGTDGGCYVSIDKGKRFYPIFKGMPNVPVHDLVIHPHESKLVVGTHGRSLYIADVSLIEKLVDSIITKELFVFDIPSITYDKYWGIKTYEWEKPETPVTIISFYSSSNCQVIIRIQTPDSLTVFEKDFEADYGLNFFNYDLTIDDRFIDTYRAYLDKNNIKNFIISDIGKHFLREGKYFVSVNYKTATTRTLLEVKPPEKSNRSKQNQ